MENPLDTSHFEEIHPSDVPDIEEADEHPWDVGMNSDEKKKWLTFMNHFDEKLAHQISSTIRKPRRRAYTLSDRGEDDEESSESDDD